MNNEFRLPQLKNDSVVTIGRWSKKPAEKISAREKLLEVYSDRFDWDIPAPADGTVQEIRAEEGAPAAVGDVIAVIDEVAVGAIPSTTRPPDHPSAPLRTSLTTRPSDPPTPRPATPIAARIAAQMQVDLSKVQGTGVHGRVTKDDVLAFISTTRPFDHAVSPARQAFIEQMTQRKQPVPHASSFIEVELANVFMQRDAHQAAWQKREGFELSAMPYIVQAVVAALKAVPIINSVFTPDGIILKKNINIGITIETEGGWRAAVIQHAQTYNLVGLARRVHELEGRTQTQPADESSNGTFTILDHGRNGSLLATPIIAPNQSAILGVGAIQQRVMIDGDQLLIRPMVYLGLTYDQRVVDDMVAGQFLAEVKQRLESMM